MTAETCTICGERVPFDGTVHLLVNAHGDEGADDYYVCEACYDAELAPLLV